MSRQKHTTLMGQRGKQNWQTLNADQPKEDVTRAAIAHIVRKTSGGRQPKTKTYKPGYP